MIKVLNMLEQSPWKSKFAFEAAPIVLEAQNETFKASQRSFDMQFLSPV